MLEDLEKVYDLLSEDCPKRGTNNYKAMKIVEQVIDELQCEE